MAPASACSCATPAARRVPLQSPKDADARALLKLLSPSGILFTAMYNADADGATQFFFPKERLPTHTQVAALPAHALLLACAALAASPPGFSMAVDSRMRIGCTVAGRLEGSLAVGLPPNGRCCWRHPLGALSWSAGRSTRGARLSRTPAAAAMSR